MQKIWDLHPSEIDNPLYDDSAPVPGVTEKLTTASRTGFQLSVPINMGGDGFGWIFEPFVNLDSDVTALGLYNGPTINIHIMDPLYIAVGFGLKVAMLSGDGLDAGADLGARVPITGTYYLFDDLGLVGELGLGYGASGYKLKAALPGEDPSYSFGTAFMWDFAVGVRWP